MPACMLHEGCMKAAWSCCVFFGKLQGRLCGGPPAPLPAAAPSPHRACCARFPAVPFKNCTCRGLNCSASYNCTPAIYVFHRGTDAAGTTLEPEPLLEQLSTGTTGALQLLKGASSFFLPCLIAGRRAPTAIKLTQPPSSAASRL